jgi:hypothetical protein
MGSAVIVSGQVRWVNIDVADNGFIVKWDEKMKKPGGGEMDHCDCISKTHLFKSEEKDEAFDFFVKLKKMEMGLPETEVQEAKEGY